MNEWTVLAILWAAWVLLMVGFFAHAYYQVCKTRRARLRRASRGDDQ